MGKPNWGGSPGVTTIPTCFTRWRAWSTTPTSLPASPIPTARPASREHRGNDENLPARAWEDMSQTATGKPNTAIPSVIPCPPPRQRHRLPRWMKKGVPVPKMEESLEGGGTRLSTKTKPSRTCSSPPSAAPAKLPLRICARSKKIWHKEKGVQGSIWCRALPPGGSPRTGPSNRAGICGPAAGREIFRRWSAPISTPNASITTLCVEFCLHGKRQEIPQQ